MSISHFILIEVKRILCIDISDVHDLKVKSETSDIRNFIQITQKCHLFSFLELI